MTWTCSSCGAVMATEEEWRRHVCRGKVMSDCPRCGGTGVIVQGLGPNINCPRCGGKGKV